MEALITPGTSAAGRSVYTAVWGVVRDGRWRVRRVVVACEEAHELRGEDSFGYAWSNHPTEELQRRSVP
jgi:hypothetical protein